LVSVPSAFTPGSDLFDATVSGLEVAASAPLGSLTAEDHWFAFYSDPTVSDFGAFGLGAAPGSPIDISGSYTVRIATTNGSRDDMATTFGATYCDVLSTAPTPLRFRINYGYPTIPPAWPAAARCTPGSTALTQFTLLDLPGGRTGLFPISGAGRFAGSDLVTLRVTDWRAADRLDVTLPRVIKVGDGLVKASIYDGQVHVLATPTPLGPLPTEESASVVAGLLGFTVGVDQRLTYTAYRPCGG